MSSGGHTSIGIRINGGKSGDINPNSPQFQAAQKACHSRGPLWQGPSVGNQELMPPLARVLADAPRNGTTVARPAAVRSLLGRLSYNDALRSNAELDGGRPRDRARGGRLAGYASELASRHAPLQRVRCRDLCVWWRIRLARCRKRRLRVDDDECARRPSRGQRQGGELRRCRQLRAVHAEPRHQRLPRPGQQRGVSQPARRNQRAEGRRQLVSVQHGRHGLFPLPTGRWSDHPGRAAAFPCQGAEARANALSTHGIPNIMPTRSPTVMASPFSRRSASGPARLSSRAR